jgi:hypothetical protein
LEITVESEGLIDSIVFLFFCLFLSVSVKTLQSLNS